MQRSVVKYRVLGKHKYELYFFQTFFVFRLLHLLDFCMEFMFSLSLRFFVRNSFKGDLFDHLMISTLE